MTPRLQLLPQCNLIGYTFRALPSENAPRPTGTCNLLGYTLGGAAGAAGGDGSGHSPGFEAEIFHLAEEIGFGGDCA